MKAKFLLLALLAFASMSAAQRVQVLPADVTVDPGRVELIQVPGEQAVTALTLSETEAGQKVFGISGRSVFVLEAGKAHAIVELPEAATTLVPMMGGKLLAGARVLDHKGRLLRDYGLKRVVAAAADRSGRAYAVTYPDGQFYVLGEKAEPKGRLCMRSLIGVDEHFYAVPKALAVDREGTVWMSGELGYVYRYRDNRLEKTPLRLPAEKGREFVNVVESFAVHPSGVIYGGTTDGYLFRLDPARNRIENLGKAAREPRIRALAVRRDGSLLGVAAEQIFAYRDGVYEIEGRIEYRRGEQPSWMAYNIDSLVVMDDGSAYLGESESRAHLFLLRPK